MDDVVQQVANGLTLGGIDSLVALGPTLVYGILSEGAQALCQHVGAEEPDARHSCALARPTPATSAGSTRYRTFSRSPPKSLFVNRVYKKAGLDKTI